MGIRRGGIINQADFNPDKTAVCDPPQGSNPSYRNYLEIDHDDYNKTDKNRYCRITEAAEATPAYDVPRDPVNQYCMKDNEPWTNRLLDDPQTYTFNCIRKIGEQYTWAIKEMSMIYSRCPVSVIIPMTLQQQQDEISSERHAPLYATLDHLLRHGNYTVGDPQEPSDGYQSTINFFNKLQEQPTPIHGYGAFVYNNIYNRDHSYLDRFDRHTTLYRAASHDMFEVSDYFVNTQFSITSINLDNTIRSAFMDDGGFLYVIKLAKDVPYIPMGRPLQGSDISRTCFPNEAEILLPPGCRFTQVHRLPSHLIRQGLRINFTIYLVYVEYMNRTLYIDQCNKYIDERSPFSPNTRQGRVNNLFKNEIRIANNLLLDGVRHYPVEDVDRATALQDFWRDYNPGTTIQTGGNITNNASQQKNDVKELLQPRTRVKPGNFSNILSK